MDAANPNPSLSSPDAILLEAARFAAAGFNAVRPDAAHFDAARLGPALVVAASLILAIRTARWPREEPRSAANPEWEAELKHSIALAHRIFAHLDAKSPFLFRRQP